MQSSPGQAQTGVNTSLTEFPGQIFTIVAKEVILECPSTEHSVIRCDHANVV